MKTAMTHHFTTTRKAISKAESKCWQGYGKLEILVYCWWKKQIVKSLWKTIRVILKKNIYMYIQRELPYDPAIVHMDICEKSIKEQAQINICTHVQQHYSQYPKVEGSQIFINGQMNFFKFGYIHLWNITPVLKEGHTCYSMDET